MYKPGTVEFKQKTTTKNCIIQLKFDAAVYLEQPSVLGHLKAEPCGKAQWLSRVSLVLLPWWPYLHVCVFMCSGCAAVKKQHRTPYTDWFKSKTYHIKSLHPDPLVSPQTQSTFWRRKWVLQSLKDLTISPHTPSREFSSMLYQNL